MPSSKQKSSSISQGKIIKNQGGNPEEIQILQWSGKDIKIIVIGMFKNVNDEIENCTGNYNKANGISKFDHSYLISMRTQ